MGVARDASVTNGRSHPPRRRRSALLSVAVVAVAGVLVARGIAVVPDREVARTDLAGNPTFDAKQFVASLWVSRVLPLMQDKATDIGTVLQALAKDPDAAGRSYGHRPRAGDGPWNFIVRGEGRIKAAETTLRHATLSVEIDGQDVELQIGPVIFGTTLRDSLPFISFDEVVNQIQFAQVSRELNDRATASAHAGLDLAALTPGRGVAFTGAMSASTPPQVTVVRLRALGAASP